MNFIKNENDHRKITIYLFQHNIYGFKIFICPLSQYIIENIIFSIVQIAVYSNFIYSNNDDIIAMTIILSIESVSKFFLFKS